MKLILWNEEKNDLLKAQRNLSFEIVLLAIQSPSRKATKQYLKGDKQ
jgi:hypothetical protein